MKNLNILLKAPSKKTSSPASSFDIFLESLNVSIDPGCICNTDDDKLLEFRKGSEKNEARRCLFQFNFCGTEDSPPLYCTASTVLMLALHCTAVSPPLY